MAHVLVIVRGCHGVKSEMVPEERHYKQMLRGNRTRLLVV